MRTHKNARLTPPRREETAVAVRSGSLSRARAARQFGVCAKIVTRWTGRFRAKGRAGIQGNHAKGKLARCCGSGWLSRGT